MKPSQFLASAVLVILLAGGAIWYIISDYYARQESNPKAKVVMYKNAGCECCDKWASYMQGGGYSVSIVEAKDLYAVKAEQGIPRDMGACHTAVVGDYVVEGHVPLEDISRLLREKPDAKGIAVPGMPASSPGMNTALNKPFNVYLLKDDGSTEIYARH